MLRRLLLCVAVVLVVTVPAGAQKIRKGELTGEVKTAFSTSTETGVPKVLVEIPKGQWFVLTQACRAGADSELALEEGGAFEFIALDPVDLCTTFTPGLAIPTEKTLVQILQVGGTGRMYVTGVLTK